MSASPAAQPDRQEPDARAGARARPPAATRIPIPLSVVAPAVELEVAVATSNPAPVEPVESDRAALTVAEVLATPATGATRWMDRAVCASGEHDPELWWPERGQPAKPARLLCADCPVLGDCRDHFTALPGRLQQAGVWAGLPAERLRAATRPRRPDRQPDQHQERRDDGRRRDRGLGR